MSERPEEKPDQSGLERPPQHPTSGLGPGESGAGGTVAEGPAGHGKSDRGPVGPEAEGPGGGPKVAPVERGGGGTTDRGPVLGPVLPVDRGGPGRQGGNESESAGESIRQHEGTQPRTGTAGPVSVELSGNT